MTFEIGLVLLILGGALVLFVTEVIRMDLAALLVLAALAVTGLVEPKQAVAGFSNPAVITVWAMFILSAGLTRTGVAEIIGRALLRWVRGGEALMITVIMLVGGVLSAFMNNIGVAALMLPVVIHMARRTGTAPSRLLMPLAYGTLLGGLTTLIGTPPNLLVSEALHEQGFEPFAFFDFAPVGGCVMLVGIAFVVFVGRHLLPKRDPSRDAIPAGTDDLKKQYRLDERSAVIRLPRGSALSGKTLREIRLGTATGLNVFAILRSDRTRLAPGSETVLHENDRLVVSGKLDRFYELRGWSQFTVEEEDPGLDALISTEIGLSELRISEGASVIGRTIGQISFRRTYGIVVLALRRESGVSHRSLVRTPLESGDRLLVQGNREEIDDLRHTLDFRDSEPFSEAELGKIYELDKGIFAVRVPPDSLLQGQTFTESRIGSALGLGVVALKRGDDMLLLPGPDERLQAGDVLVARGNKAGMNVFRALQALEIESESYPELHEFDTGAVKMMEVILSPRTSLVGKSPAELRFRDRYGFQILAILRRGRAYRSNPGGMKLEFGDALLLVGPSEKRRLLSADPDFLILTEPAQAPKRERSPVAALIMVAVIVPVLFGWLPIAISAVAGAALMVLARCLSMDEAYRAIEWRAVFLIAGMLPLGVALEQTGAAAFIAEGLLVVASPLGPWGIVAGLYLVTALATSIIPTAALVVLMAPIAFRACAETGLSPYAVMMAIAMAASASFTSPVSHPANVLVMGPGGYRFVDYVKVGVPLTLVVFVIVLLILPIFWPLQG